jgi:putative Mg2+ transporter-C (MgtC) family protein
MDGIWSEFFGVRDQVGPTQIMVRLGLAVVLGALLGIERQREGKAAGLRTHMLVALGSSLFVLASLTSDMPVSDLSRVIQGVATGIGFMGAGTILKLPRQREIEGLTTAASVWLTAGVGIGIAMGRLWLSIAAAILGYVILSFVGAVERR